MIDFSRRSNTAGTHGAAPARKAYLIAVVVFTAFLILALSGSTAARAQVGSVEGRVTDASNTPLPGVNVVVAGTTRGAASLADGSYRIDGLAPGRYTLTASAVGYEPRTAQVEVAPRETSQVAFVLTEVAIQSGEVVVTASRRGKLAGRVAASLTAVSPEEIEARIAIDLDDVLRHVSGVQMVGNQINIRGSSGFSYNTGSRVLLLIDGAPMLRPDVNGVPYDAIPMSQVQRIEILKGPGSSLYGGGALGGVINVITKDVPEGPETSLSGYGGVYQPVRYAAWRDQWEDADLPQPVLGLSVGHARPLGSRVGMWAHAAYQYDAGHLRRDRRKNLQVYSKVMWRPRDGAQMSVLGGLTRRTSDNFLFWNGIDDPLNPGRIDFGRSGESSGSDDNLINELSLLPTYSNVVTRDLLLTLRGRVFGVLIQPLDEFGDPKPIGQGTVGVRYGGEIQGDYSPASARTITFGAAIDANAARSSYFEDDASLSQPEAGVFMQWEESPHDDLTIAVGTRYDLYRIREGDTTSKLSPKLSASYALNDRWIVRGAYADGFRVPSVLERFVSNADYLPLVSNLELRPETSRSFEVGVRAYPYAGAVKSVVDAAVFWSSYRRLIEPKFVPAVRAFQFVNLTRARIRGMEINGRVTSPGERSALQVGYTLLDARDLTTEEPLAFRSSHLLTASASTTFRRVRIAVDFRFASKPERVDTDFAMFVKDADRTVPIRVVDLRAGSTWRGIGITLHLKNALDYYYVERPALLAPPRQLILQIAKRF